MKIGLLSNERSSDENDASLDILLNKNPRTNTVNKRTQIRYQGRVVTRQWLKKWAGKTPEDNCIRTELAKRAKRVPADSPETFDRTATIMWFAQLDDETLGDVWRYARELQRKPGKPNCRHCGGTGRVVYTAGGDTRMDECGCLQK